MGKSEWISRQGHTVIQGFTFGILIAQVADMFVSGTWYQGDWLKTNVLVLPIITNWKQGLCQHNLKKKKLKYDMSCFQR